MKKLICGVLACLMVVSMLASAAFVVKPTYEDKSQFSLISIKAVDLKVAATGIRSYADVVDTTRGYQVDDLIQFATTFEIANLAKDRNLTSIGGKAMDLVIGSATADLSYSNYGTPVVLSAVYSGEKAENLLTAALPLTGSISYKRSTNEVTVKMEGYDEIDGSIGSQGALYNSFGGYLQLYAAYEMGGKLMIPAINAKDYDDVKYDYEYIYKVNIGGETYEIPMQGTAVAIRGYEAPEAMQYTVIIAGVTEEATKGEMTAKVKLTGAEKFAAKDGYKELVIKDKYIVRKYTTEINANNLDLINNAYKTNYKLTDALVEDGAYRGVGASVVQYDIFLADGKKIDTDALYTRGGYIASIVTEYAPNPAYRKAKTIGLFICRDMDGVTSLGADSFRINYGGNGTWYVGNVALDSKFCDEVYDMLRFFGFNYTLDYTYEVQDADFESKGAAATYTDEVVGSYNYGTLEILEDVVEEGTEEEVVEEEPVEEEPVEEEPVVATGDASANVAIALAAAAIVAAAALAFVMKKAR